MDSWSPADIMVNLAELLMDVNFLADMKLPMHIQSPADMKVEFKRSSIPLILNWHSLELSSPPLPSPMSLESALSVTFDSSILANSNILGVFL